MQQSPLEKGTTVFTDGSSNGIASLVIENQSYYCQTSHSSAQEVELFAALQALQRVPQSFNLYSDSHYVVRALSVIETVPLTGASKASIQTSFLKIQDLIRTRTHPCFLEHIRAHTALPGPLTVRNALGDEATRMVCYSSLTPISVAQASSARHHQNSNSLWLQFGISREAARHIVKTCRTCPQFFVLPTYEVNPRGLFPNDLWQMDVTHISDFGKLKYVHVTIDTFSGFIMATLQSGETSKHCIQHCLWSFSTMGLPKCIKTDNGPGYVGRNFQTFCAQLRIVHKTGIPYNPRGQGIVE